MEREAWRALGPAGSEEVLGAAAAREEPESEVLSLVSLNVAGIGDYGQPSEARMDAILTLILRVEPEPDVLVLQEMTAPMLAQLRLRLPHWSVCRRREVSEY